MWNEDMNKKGIKLTFSFINFSQHIMTLPLHTLLYKIRSIKEVNWVCDEYFDDDFIGNVKGFFVYFVCILRMVKV